MKKDDAACSPDFFRTLSSWRRQWDFDEAGEQTREMITLEFAEGGRVDIFTELPLLFIEPERH